MPAGAERSVRESLSRLAATIRRVVGAPDYEAYLAHRIEHHPREEPLTREQFARDAMSRRYDRPGSRCC